MAQQSCPNGKPYPNKRTCQDAHPGQRVRKCDHCRGYHPDHKSRKGDRTKRRRNNA